MAIALVNDDVTNSIPRTLDDTDATSYSLNAGGPAGNGLYTPAANSLLVAIFQVSDKPQPDGSPPCDGHGVTYTSIQGNTCGGVGRFGIYAADSGASPTNAATTIRYSSAGATGCNMYELEFTGVDLSGGVLAAFVQVVYQEDGEAPGTSVTNTLLSASSSDNRQFLAVAINANEAITEDASHAEVHDAGRTTPARRLAVAYNNSATFDTSVTSSWTTSLIHAQYAVELKAAGGAGAPQVARRMLLGVGV